ncbi:MAG: RNA pseudouridine synthase [Bacteroidales bacterium]|jgi:23S rRNA pseudouridine1911/1915/1917 synthase|nr:RNA pseudouridine synthase [Bacteroidales bacterium]
MNPNNTDEPILTEDRVLYEDNHLIIVNKRAKEPVQADVSGDKALQDMVRDYIRVKKQKTGNVFCGLVHRIDRPVSGAVILTKTSKALSRMIQIVKDRNIDKIYWAIVEGCPDPVQGKLVNYLIKNEAKNRTTVYDEEHEGCQRAELDYEVLVKTDRYSLVEVKLMTGRHHQIRAQLSHIGCPIKGDLKYGARRSNEDGSISLHARRLRFEHPVSHIIIDVVAPPFNPLFEKILNQENIDEK